jgi:hypothetical protein
MRGFLHPALRTLPTEPQAAFQALSRSRRTKLARAANTTLVKADQWARGTAVSADVGEALERALASGKAKKK